MSSGSSSTTVTVPAQSVKTTGSEETSSVQTALPDVSVIVPPIKTPSAGFSYQDRKAEADTRPPDFFGFESHTSVLIL